MFTEMNKLGYMLACTLIPYEMTKLYNGYHIEYPNHDNCICSVVCHDFSYGHQDGLLEIMGLLTEEEAEFDSVKGWLDADEVFKRISRDYFHKEEE